MRLTVLGCNGPYPAAGGATSGYLLEDEEVCLLLDCGSGVLSNLMELMNPAELQAICLSHIHFDHASDLLPLQYYLQKAGHKMPLYAPEDDSPMRALLNAPAYDLKDYPDEIVIGHLKITTHTAKHPVPCRAIKVQNGDKTFVYTGDAAEGESLAAFCTGADFLLADGAFLDKEWHEKAPHMSAKMAGQLASDAGVKQLVITHIPPHQVPEHLLAEAKSVFRHTKIATVGASYVL